MQSKKVTGMKVIRLTKTEFELDNGDIYPLPFELDEAISIKEFNKIYAGSKDIADMLMGLDKQDEKNTNN